MSLPAIPKIRPPDNNPLAQAMYDIAEALEYPVDHRGRVYDVRFMLPQLAYHLARAGIGKVPGQAIIKKRRLPPTPGVVGDAVEWVGLDAAPSIEDELAGATVEDIDRLSPAARAELIRRLGGNNPEAVNTDLDGRTPWRVETSIHFDDDDQES